jgi:hypothetical protein
LGGALAGTWNPPDEIGNGGGITDNISGPIKWVRE